MFSKKILRENGSDPGRSISPKDAAFRESLGPRPIAWAVEELEDVNKRSTERSEREG
jgi:hypothetical protein